MAPPSAELVAEALEAGGMRPVAWAAHHSAASPYPFDYWLSQAVARRGMGAEVAWNIRADDARKERIEKWAAAKWAELAKTTKGKK
jgi:hypothetical protein